MTCKPTDPHAIESHSQAHKEAFDSLVERVSNALKRQTADPRLKQGIGSETTRIYPGPPRRTR